MILIVNVVFVCLLLPALVVRWLRWLAVVQQKEYRLDRLQSFLRTTEGQRDLWRLRPQRSDFTRTGLKRPVKTIRVLIVAVLSFSVCSKLLMLTMYFAPQLLVIAAVVVYVLLPAIVMLACVPSVAVVSAVTWGTLWRAQRKLRAHHPRIIGIGGSYGKTSTKHLLAHVLSQKYTVFVTPKSHNTKYSVAKSICDRYTGQEIAILEYGSYKIGEIAYLTQWFPPQLAVETGFTLQHLGIFGSAENSLHAEAELIAAVPSTSTVFCHGEDPGAREICKIGRQKNQVEVVEYSGANSVVSLTALQLDAFGRLHFEWHGHQVQTQIVGRHYQANIQGVIAVAQSLQLTEQEILRGLESFQPNECFVRSVQLRSGAFLIDDGGTSNPKGFAAAMELAAELPYARKTLLTSGIVDLGEEAVAVHYKLAKQAKEIFSQVLYFGVDGLGEFQQVLGERVLSDPSSIQNVLQQLSENDLVVIEGKLPKHVTSYFS